MPQLVRTWHELNARKRPALDGAFGKAHCHQNDIDGGRNGKHRVHRLAENVAPCRNEGH